MMEPVESCVPPGFRFHPTDEELVGYYLKKKVASQRIDLDVIRDIDLYRIEPWDLQERCRIGYEEQKEWYFFSHKDKKYPTGTRTNRATMAGFWKATGRDKAVYKNTILIGMRKTLVFYKGRAPNGQKTNWIMHEYRLETDENGPPQEEGWVVCRAFKKKTSVQSNSSKVTTDHQPWDSLNYFYEETSSTGHVLSSTSLIHPSSSSSFSSLCKQGLDHHLRHHHPLHLYQSADPFLQLPDLESPNSIRFLSSGSRPLEAADWGALDKFVASQLSHGHDHQVGSGSVDMALLLLQNSGKGEEEGSEGGDKFINGFLAPSSAGIDLGVLHV